MDEFVGIAQGQNPGVLYMVSSLFAMTFDSSD